MEISITTVPRAIDIEFITTQIDAENPEFGKTQPFALMVRDYQQSIIAGCNGFVLFGVIYTDQLWVKLQYRKQGIATKIMHKVHDYGRQLHCKFAKIDTMSFQNALNFYQKLGYIVEVTRHGYINNATLISLSKYL